jgi:hypothetical protein
MEGESPAGVDWSLAGLQELLRSEKYIGDEMYLYVSEVLQVNIHVLFGTAGPDGLLPYSSTGCRFPISIFIVAVGKPGTGRHYELLTVYQNSDGRPLRLVPPERQTPQTITQFQATAPIMIAYRSFELYRKIFASFKTIYEKYAVALEAGVTDPVLYSDLDGMIEAGKDIYEKSYSDMLDASTGSIERDVISSLENSLQDITELEKRAVSSVYRAVQQ